MSYVVSFVDFQPEPRFDNVPWARVLVSEAAARDGIYTQIDDIMLTPADADPTSPAVRSFSTDNATLPSGWYRITFRDAGGNDSLPVAPVHLAAEYVLNYTPTVTQVATQILSRTQDQYGNIKGTFDNTTKPTAEEVHDMALSAAGKLSLQIGDQIPDALLEEASDVAATRAAMDVELTYFSDQVATGRSIYPQLKELYDQELVALQKAVTSANDDGGVVIDQGSATAPSYSFPTASDWLTRRM
jgi:hypothetical protein